MENGDPFSLISVLMKHEVDFVVLGGHAVAFHGYPRATEDTDILFRRNPTNETALFHALRSVDARWIGNDIDPKTGIERQYPVTQAYLESTHLMMLITDAGFLDVFDYIPGMPDEPVDEVFNTCKFANGIRFVSLDWLRRMKRAANRPKDRLDLDELSRVETDNT
ncbi:MAG: hypothetical protein ACOCUY_01910 [Verrucomicrobiota bacterium]